MKEEGGAHYYCAKYMRKRAVCDLRPKREKPTVTQQKRLFVCGISYCPFDRIRGIRVWILSERLSPKLRLTQRI